LIEKAALLRRFFPLHLEMCGVTAEKKKREGQRISPSLPYFARAKL
jgi:hypothetical protein